MYVTLVQNISASTRSVSSLCDSLKHLNLHQIDLFLSQNLAITCYSTLYEKWTLFICIHLREICHGTIVFSSHLSPLHQPSLHPPSPPSDPHMAVHVSNHQNPESLHTRREIGRINQEFSFFLFFFPFAISFILSFPLHSHPNLIHPPVPHADHPRFI